MIGALAIKRRRKKAGGVEPPPPVQSRHCGFIYILGGVAFVTGVILLIPAIITSNGSTLFIISGSLLGGGCLILVIACCWSNSTDEADEVTNHIVNRQNDLNQLDPKLLKHQISTDLTTLNSVNFLNTEDDISTTVDMTNNNLNNLNSNGLSVIYDGSRASSSTGGQNFEQQFNNGLPLVST